ncbi:MAG: hypothetical protein ACRCSU_14070 [Paracoccaceae bacterium]
MSRRPVTKGLIAKGSPALWDFSILLSITLMLRTLPFLFFRMLVSVVSAFAIALAIWAGIGLMNYLEGLAIVPDMKKAILIGALFGLVAAAWLAKMARRWVMYLIKTAHIAVLVEMIQNRPLPSGQSQIGFGHRVVKDRFGEVSALFVLDELIRTVVRAVNRTFLGIVNFLPERVARPLAASVTLLLHFGLSFLDEIVLAHAIDKQSANPWGSARNALILYGQNWKIVLKNAIWLTLFVLAISAVIYTTSVEPALAEYQATQDRPAFFHAFVIILLAVIFFNVIFEPFALICLMQVWFRRISEDRPSAEWSHKVSHAAPQLDQFRGIDSIPAGYTGIGAERLHGAGPVRNGDIV